MEDLRQKFSELSDTALIKQITAGRGSYRDGVYELLAAEAHRRNLDEAVAAAGEKDRQAKEAKEHESRIHEWDKDLSFLALFQVPDGDCAFLESVLNETDIPYCFSGRDSMYKGIPIILMVERGRLDESRELLKDYIAGLTSASQVSPGSEEAAGPQQGPVGRRRLIRWGSVVLWGIMLAASVTGLITLFGA
ncbi:MAG: hypothetical protein PHT59_08010, partial [Candidatus Omnitrophica bacterium]|nr:hypothetical protein [Candidatus Omnitrophota bacterium]